MAIAYKDSTGNYALDQLYDNKFPAGSLVDIRTGAAPGPNAAASGTRLAQITTPATPWAAAATKSKAKQGVWSVAAVATGTAAHYRLTNAADTEREEGTVGLGSGDLSLDNTSIAIGQTVTINTFTRTS
jgi:transglutaminase/protease-like cytokinesis protein 3